GVVDGQRKPRRVDRLDRGIPWRGRRLEGDGAVGQRRGVDRNVVYGPGSAGCGRERLSAASERHRLDPGGRAGRDLDADRAAHRISRLLTGGSDDRYRYIAGCRASDALPGGTAYRVVVRARCVLYARDLATRGPRAARHRERCGEEDADGT